jgi:hypothetical protein
MQKPSSLADLNPPPSVFAFLKPVSSVARRQNLILSIPATYGGLNAGPSPGTVVGIVLGTVTGIVLILLVIYSIFGLDGNGSITRRSVSPPRRRRTAEIVDISSSRPRSRRDAIIVEEDMTPSQDDNVVEVIEELSDVSPPPPRRAHSGRTSGSYRPAEPLAYGGGDEPYGEYDY